MTTEPIRVLIADDEPLAREGMRLLLAGDADLVIVGEAGTGEATVAAILELRPDLVFLDIEMPLMTGFEALAALDPRLMPIVVFVTAYNQYALKAFDAHALDYLLKPLDRERLRQAVQRVKRQVALQRESTVNRRILACLQELQTPPKFLDRIIVRSGDSVFFVKVEEIDWIESEGNYVRLHVGKQSHIIRETLSRIESQLNPEKFTRIHRTTIVQTDRISRIEPRFHGDCIVVLADGTQLTLSRSYRRNIGEF
jgi:two-component system LytT family response regulator